MLTRTQSSVLDLGVRTMMPSHFPAILLMSVIAAGDGWSFALAANEISANPARTPITRVPSCKNRIVLLMQPPRDQTSGVGFRVLATRQQVSGVGRQKTGFGFQVSGNTSAT